VSHICEVDLSKDTAQEQQAWRADLLRANMITQLKMFTENFADNIQAGLQKQFEVIMPVLENELRKAVNSEINAISDATKSLLIPPIRVSITPAYENAGDAALEVVDVAVGFDLSSPEAVAYLRRKPITLAEDINRGTKSQLKRAFRRNLEEGGDIDTLTTRIQGIMGFGDAGRFRAERIARTEMADVVNKGTLDGYGQSGVVQKKQWLSANDARPAHLQASGQERLLRQDFIVGGEKAKYPADPRLSPSNRINCRCTITPIVDQAVFAVPADVPEPKADPAKSARDRIIDDVGDVAVNRTTMTRYNKARDLLTDIVAGDTPVAPAADAVRELREEYRAGLSEYLKRKGLTKEEIKKATDLNTTLMSNWVGSSSSPGAGAMKDWSAERFGGDVLFHRKEIDPKRIAKQIGFNYEDLGNLVNVSQKRAKELTQLGLDYQYAWNQEILKRTKVKKRVLKRGVNAEYFDRRGLPVPKTSKTFSEVQNSMASWTGKKETGFTFGEVTLESKVRVEDIFSDEVTLKVAGEGISFFFEEEVVVISSDVRKVIATRTR